MKVIFADTRKEIKMNDPPGCETWLYTLWGKQTLRVFWDKCCGEYLDLQSGSKRIIKKIT
jgi:hypothetical protein